MNPIILDLCQGVHTILKTVKTQFYISVNQIQSKSNTPLSIKFDLLESNDIVLEGLKPISLHINLFIV